MLQQPLFYAIIAVFVFLQFIVALIVISAKSHAAHHRKGITQSKPEIGQNFRMVVPLKSRKSSNLSNYVYYGSEDFQYPLLVDMVALVNLVKSGKEVSVKEINKPNFPYVISNSEKCKNSQIFILMLIKTAPSNIENRNIIRSTWGNESCWGNHIVRRLFLIGYSNVEIQKKIIAEQSKFGDLVQQRFIDHYDNNTYKMMLGFKWAQEFCSNAKFVMFADDDYFIHPSRAFRYLDSINQSSMSRFIAGYAWRVAFPRRRKRGKWYISYKEYPWSTYPPYVAAGCFFVSISMVEKVNIAVRYTRYLRFDDVYLGLVLHKLLIVPQHILSIYSFNSVPNKKNHVYYNMIASHGYKKIGDIKKTWVDLKCHEFCLDNRTVLY